MNSHSGNGSPHGADILSPAYRELKKFGSLEATQICLLFSSRSSFQLTTVSNSGGGNRENITLQSGDIPLRWMQNEAIMAGLIFHPTDIDWKAEDLERRPERSLKLGWWLMELLPIPRLSYGKKDATHRSESAFHVFCELTTTIRPHRGRGRKIVSGQKLHVSVLLKPRYRPKAKSCPPDDTWPTCVDFNDPCELEKLTDLDDKWEKDHFDPAMASFLVDKLRQPGCQPLEFIIRICHIASLSL